MPEKLQILLTLEDFKEIFCGNLPTNVRGIWKYTTLDIERVHVRSCTVVHGVTKIVYTFRVFIILDFEHWNPEFRYYTLAVVITKFYTSMDWFKLNVIRLYSFAVQEGSIMSAEFTQYLSSRVKHLWISTSETDRSRLFSKNDATWKNPQFYGSGSGFQFFLEQGSYVDFKYDGLPSKLAKIDNRASPPPPPPPPPKKKKSIKWITTRETFREKEQHQPLLWVAC